MNPIRSLREKARLSQAALARLANTSQPQIKRLEDGDRTLTKEWAERLAPALHVTAEDILFPERSRFAEVVMAPVLGTIQAGVWREAVAILEPERMPIVDIDGRAPESLYVLRVAGDSMDMYVRDGGYVVCMNLHAFGREIRPGMIVHVERRKFDGELVETTLKELALLEGKQALVPRSSNPSHKAIRGAADGEEVEIRGVVVARYEPAPFV